VAVLFAREGADVAILYLDQHQDAEQTRKDVEQHGRRCLTFAGDVADRDVCRKVSTRRWRSSASWTSWSTMQPSSIPAIVSRTSRRSSGSRPSVPTCSACSS